MGGRAVTKVFEEACARLESDHPVSTQEMAEKIAACPLAVSYTHLDVYKRQLRVSVD